MGERNVVIAGYYGFGNAGDEAILTATVNAFRRHRPKWQLTVLSARPRLTERNHAVRAIPRFNLPQVVTALLRADLFLFGGGSLLQDTTSLRSLLYYLTMLNLPLLAGKPVMVYANGFGPVRSVLGRWGCRYTLNRVPVITLRDSDSLGELRALGVNRPELEVTADPAFLLTPLACEAASELLRAEDIASDDGWLMVSVRHWPGLNSVALATALDRFATASGLGVLFVPMHGKADRDYSRQVADHMTHKAHILQEDYQPEQLLGIISCATLLLGMRMHAIIFAAATHVPAAGITYDPKVTSLLQDLQLPIASHAHALCPDSICHHLDGLLAQRHEISQRLMVSAEKMRQQALGNIERALALVEN